MSEKFATADELLSYIDQQKAEGRDWFNDQFEINREWLEEFMICLTAGDWKTLRKAKGAMDMVQLLADLKIKELAYDKMMEEQ